MDNKIESKKNDDNDVATEEEERLVISLFVPVNKRRRSRMHSRSSSNDSFNSMRMRQQEQNVIRALKAVQNMAEIKEKEATNNNNTLENVGAKLDSDTSAAASASAAEGSNASDAQDHDDAHTNEDIEGEEENENDEALSVEQKLMEAEERFLHNDAVTPPNVSLDKIAERYSSTTTPTHKMFNKDLVPKYMDDLVNKTVTDAVNTASPNMIGHMTSSLPYYTRPLSRLITAMNQNSVKTETANTVTFLEREAIAQLHRAIYNLDESFYKSFSLDPTLVLGVFTSGGTLANITALWVARNVALGPSSDNRSSLSPASEKQKSTDSSLDSSKKRQLNSSSSEKPAFQGIEKEGVFAAMKFYGYEGAVVIGSDLLHYSVAKGLDVLGFGTQSLVTVPYDERFRVRVSELERAIIEHQKKNIKVIALIGIAGSTEAGSIDPLDEIADLAEKYKIHFHVDAAWGGPGVFSRKQREKLKGIERADSVTLDGHKQLYMPMGCGLCFFRDPTMSRYVRKTAKYIIRIDSHDLGKFTLEGSRPANAVYLHSNLNILGVRGYEILVNRSVRMTEYMAQRIKELAPKFELIVEPMSNILLYRALPHFLTEEDITKLGVVKFNEICDEINVTLQNSQKLRGRTFVSRTTVQSMNEKYKGVRIVALRVVIANPLTYEADIDRVLEDQQELLVQILTGIKDRLSREDNISITDTSKDQAIKNESSAILEGSVDTPTNQEKESGKKFIYAVSSLNADVDEQDGASSEQSGSRDEPWDLSGSSVAGVGNEKQATATKYWKGVWNSFSQTVRGLFKDDEEYFLNSLINPDLGLTDENGGLLLDDRYRRHLSEIEEEEEVGVAAAESAAGSSSPKKRTS